MIKTLYRYSPLCGLTLMLLGTEVSAAGAAPVRLDFDQRIGERSERIGMRVTPSQVAVLDAQQRPSLLFDRRSAVLTLLDHEQRSYRRLDPARIKRLADDVNAALTQARAEASALPAAERALAEQRLQELLGAPAKPPAAVHFKLTAQKGEFADQACRWYEIRTGSTPTGRVCAAPPTQVPGGEAVMALLGAMAKTYDALNRQTLLPLALPANPLLPLLALGQLPLSLEETRAGVMNRSRLLAIRPLEGAADLLVPAGFSDGFGGTP